MTSKQNRVPAAVVTLGLPLATRAADKKNRLPARQQAFTEMEKIFEDNGVPLPAELTQLKQELFKNRKDGVCALVRVLIMDDVTYPTNQSIADECIRQFPGAQTSPDSVSSIGKHMRAEGIPVPYRNRKRAPSFTAAGRVGLGAFATMVTDEDEGTAAPEGAEHVGDGVAGE